MHVIHVNLAKSNWSLVRYKVEKGLRVVYIQSQYCSTAVSPTFLEVQGDILNEHPSGSG